jgi:ribosomal protein S18 acetylase RimI-like enzyme
MNLANASDRDVILEIFLQSYKDNPHVRYLIGDQFVTSRLKTLANFVFDIAMKRKGIYLSEDKQGVVVMFPCASIQLNSKEKIKQYLMVIRAFNLYRLFKIINIEAAIKLERKANPNDLYVWFYGVSEQGAKQDTARKLMKAMFELSLTQQVDLIAETSLARNQKIYERFGFVTYHQHAFDFPVYFMRRAHEVRKTTLT